MHNKELMEITDNEIDKLILFCDDFDNAIVCRNLNGIITFYNKGAEELYGYSKEEIIGKSISVFTPVERESEFLELLNNIKSGIKVENFETLRKKKNGEIINIIVSIYPVTKNGKVIGSIGISRDVIQKEVYKLDIQAGKYGVWDWEINTNTVYYSNRCKEMLGFYNNNGCINYNRILSKIHIEDITMVLNQLKNHFKDEIPIEYRLKCENGQYKWLRTRGRIIKWDNEGKPLRVTGINEDINQEMFIRIKAKQDENRINALCNSISAGIALGEIILDNAGNPVDYRNLHMNDYMTNIIGIKNGNNNDEYNLKLLPKIRRDWFAMFKEVAINGKYFDFEDYNEAMCKYYNVNIYSPNPMQFALLVTDITDNKKRENELIEKYEELQAVYEELSATEEELRSNYLQLEKAKQQVEKADKAKSQFLANMSHELRTPLNGILGCTQLLKISNLSEEQKESVKIIENSSNNLLNLVNDILDLTKIDFGKIKIDYQKFDFVELMDYVIKDLNLLSLGKDIEIIYNIDPYISRELIGDSFRLKQVLNNLISNAVKFTEHGHIYLKVLQLDRTLDETKLKFIVKDTGKGIKEDFKKEVFNKFTQEDSSYSKKYGGTGLGLAISKELVKMMGGEMGFDSKTNSGSMFYFTSVLKNVSEKNNTTNKKEKHVIMSKSSKNILVVEDNEINLKIVSTYLKELNYKFVCVHNGQEAIDYLENNKADIILMDIQMPILNGYEATKIIREKEKNTGEHKTIIAQAAYVMEGDSKKNYDCGMDGYICKPFEIEALAEILNKY